MTAIQSCMGGWCSKRGHCAHYHASAESQEPAERLCPPGLDGAGLQSLPEQEIFDMSQIRFSTAARIDQVAAILKPEGVTTAVIAEALELTRSMPRLSIILNAALEEGRVFRTYARVSEVFKTPEWVYFPTEADRDAFRAAYDVKMAERKKARHRAKSHRNYIRNRSAEIAARSAKRAAVRMEKESRAIEAAALRLAEAEQRKQRDRLEREAKAAAKEREKAEAKKTRLRLKVETAQAGQLVFKKGTDTAAPPKPTGPARIAGELDLSRAKVTVAPPVPDRWAAAKAPSVISSNECRKWAEAVAA